MLSRFKSAGLLGASLLALAALAVLLGLGTWQLQRKVWKDGLQKQINAGTQAQPVVVTTGDSIASMAEYTRVRVRGRFQHDRERYLYAPDPKLGPGYQVYTPLQLADGHVLMVNRGFVTEALRDPAKRAAGQIAGDVELVGLLRAPGVQAQFTPPNEPGRNLWYWRDLAAMAGPGSRVVPRSLDVEAVPAPPGGWPKGGTTVIVLPNRHLEYAVTWYGLALTLVGVYFAFARGRLKAAAAARG